MARTRTFTALFALGRLGFGAGLLASPERLASGWLGRDARRGPTKLAVRALGARDVAISAGTLATLREERPDQLRLWLAAAVLSDVVDTAATAATAGDALPANARWGTVVLGGGSALAGFALLRATRR